MHRFQACPKVSYPPPADCPLNAASVTNCGPLEHTEWMAEVALTHGEIELLTDGLSDYVDFGWVLVRLDIRGNPPIDPGPPSEADVDAAFSILDGLSDRGLIKVGHMEYDDGGPPGRLAPIHHVEDPLGAAKASVLEGLMNSASDDWKWNCWVENTNAGSDLIRTVLDPK